jgi:hypothetical protein
LALTPDAHASLQLNDEEMDVLLALAAPIDHQ